MATTTISILDALRSSSAYPVPTKTILTFCAVRGLDATATATTEVTTGRDYNLVFADLLKWLSQAPNVTQGGISYSLTDSQRLQYSGQADAMYSKYGEADETGNYYGYKGEFL